MDVNRFSGLTVTFPILKYIKSRTTNIEVNVTGILLQLIKRIYYTVVTRYEFYCQVARRISHD